jgi:hypothetical protein
MAASAKLPSLARIVSSAASRFAAYGDRLLVAIFRDKIRESDLGFEARGQRVGE